MQIEGVLRKHAHPKWSTPFFVLESLIETQECGCGQCVRSWQNMCLWNLMTFPRILRFNIPTQPSTI